MRKVLFAVMLSLFVWSGQTWSTDLGLKTTQLGIPEKAGDLFGVQLIAENVSDVGGGPFDSPNTKVTLSFNRLGTLIKFERLIDIDGVVVSSNASSSPSRSFIAELGTLKKGETKQFEVELSINKCADFEGVSGKIKGDLVDPFSGNNESGFELINRCELEPEKFNLGPINAVLRVLLDEE